MTLANLSADASAEVELKGIHAASATGRVLSGEIHALNDFDASPLTTRPLDVLLREDGACLTLPPCAVAEVTLAC